MCHTKCSCIARLVHGKFADQVSLAKCVCAAVRVDVNNKSTDIRCHHDCHLLLSRLRWSWMCHNGDLGASVGRSVGGIDRSIDRSISNTDRQLHSTVSIRSRCLSAPPLTLHRKEATRCCVHKHRKKQYDFFFLAHSRRIAYQQNPSTALLFFFSSAQHVIN